MNALLFCSTTIRQLDFEKPNPRSPDSLSAGRLEKKYQNFHELADPLAGNINSQESPIPRQLQRISALSAQIGSPWIQPQSPVNPNAELPLPVGYKMIKEMFQSTDVVVSMMQYRGETCTFAKLKQAVERMTRR